MPALWESGTLLEEEEQPTNAEPPTPDGPAWASAPEIPTPEPASTDRQSADPAKTDDGPDAIDLFNYHVADNTNKALQGLFRGLASRYDQEIPDDPAATGRMKENRKSLESVAEALEKYRTEKLLPSYKVKEKDLKSTAGQVTGAAATFGDILLGSKTMILKLAGQTYGEVYNDAASKALDDGETDEEKVRAKAHEEAQRETIKMAPILMAYALGGKLGAKGAEMILPEAAGPLARFVTGASTAAAANTTVSGGMRLAEGQPFAGDLEQQLTDIFFGIPGGVHGALRSQKKGGEKADGKEKEKQQPQEESAPPEPAPLAQTEAGTKGTETGPPSTEPAPAWAQAPETIQGERTQAAPETRPDQTGREISGGPSGTGQRAESISADQPTTETQTGVAGFPVARVATEQIVSRPDLMQFKAMDDTGTGENKNDKITAPYDQLKAGNLLLWEPTNPQEYGLEPPAKYIVANGHHRDATAKQQNIGQQNAQILRESAGYSAGDARTIAAEANIADGKGTIYDQTKFIRNLAATHGPDAALERAGQIGARGRKAATIALAAEPDLYASFLNEQVTPEAAAAIANIAPRDAGLQRLGISRAVTGQSPEEIGNFLQAVKAKVGSTPSPEQVDLFGADETAIKEAERAAKRAGGIQREIGEQINSVLGASKRPEKAAALGVNVADPASLKAKLDQLQALRERARNWVGDAEIRDLALKGEGTPADFVKLLQQPPATTSTIGVSGEPAGMELEAARVAEEPGRVTAPEPELLFKIDKAKRVVTLTNKLKKGDVIDLNGQPKTFDRLAGVVTERRTIGGQNYPFARMALPTENPTVKLDRAHYLVFDDGSALKVEAPYRVIKYGNTAELRRTTKPASESAAAPAETGELQRAGERERIPGASAADNRRPERPGDEGVLRVREDNSLFESRLKAAEEKAVTNSLPKLGPLSDMERTALDKLRRAGNSLSAAGKRKLAELEGRATAQDELLPEQPFNLAGEQGIDFAARQREAEAAAQSAAEARAIEESQQQTLFKPGPQPQTLPRQISRGTPNPAITAAPLSEAEIRAYLSDALDIPIRAGMNVAGGLKGAEGAYRVKPETIRTRLRNDLPTIAHEVGHYLHHILLTNPRGKPADFGKTFDAELLQLGKATSLPTYSSTQVRMEGVANFMEAWLQDRPAALAKAPGFTAYFESELQTKFPQTWEIVNNAQEMVKRLLSQPGWETAKARIVSDPQPPRTTFRKFMERMYDGWFNRIKPIDRSVAKLVEFGLDSPAARRVIELAINSQGGYKSKAEFDLQFEQRNLKGERVGPGFREIFKGLAPKEIPDFEAYAVLLRAKEKLRQGVKTGFEDVLTDPEVQRKLTDLQPRYEQRRQLMLNFERNALRLLRDSGFFSDAQIARMEAMNKDFVPFYRIYEGISGAQAGPKASGGFVNTSSGVFRMRGSDRLIVSPFESIVKNNYAFRELAEMNQVGREFTSAVMATQGGGRIGESILKPVKPIKATAEEVEQHLRKLGMDEEDIKRLAMEGDLAMTIFRASEGVNVKDGIYRVWENGQEKLFQVADRDLLQALTLTQGTESSNSTWKRIVKPMAVMTRWLRIGATYTPDFAVRNVFRDQFSAAMYSKFGYRIFFDGVKSIFEVVGQGKHYREWVANNGRYSGLYDIEGATLKQTLEQVIREPNAMRTAMELIDPRNIITNLGKAVGILESATRVGEYRRAIEKGADPLTASNASKDVTLPFAAGGNMSKAVNQLWAFFNANMLDIRKFFAAHKEAPGRTFLNGLKYITSLSMLSWWLGKDDEEIQNLPEWRKRYFWNFNVGKLAETDFVLSLPKPFLAGAVYGTSVEKGLDYLSGRDPNALYKAMGAIIQSGPATEAMMVAGNLFKPIVENIANYSFFTDRQLVSQSQQGLSPALQYTPGLTSETAKWLGEQIGVAPIKIDNAIRGYFGGLGKYGTDMVDWFMLKMQAQDTPERPAKSLAQLPVIRGFTPSPYEASEYVGRFYKALDQAETRQHDFKLYSNRLDTPGMRKFLLKNRDQLVWYNAETGGENEATVMTELRRSRDYMSDISKAMVMVQQTNQLDGQEKAARLAKLAKMRDAIAEATFKKYVHPADRRKVF